MSLEEITEIDTKQNVLHELYIRLGLVQLKGHSSKFKNVFSLGRRGRNRKKCSSLKIAVLHLVQRLWHQVCNLTLVHVLYMYMSKQLGRAHECENWFNNCHKVLLCFIVCFIIYIFIFILIICAKAEVY